MANVMAARGAKDVQASIEAQRKAREALQHIADLERQIRHMTRLYKERLEGRRRDVAR